MSSEFRFTVDDMPARRQRAAQQVNDGFAALAAVGMHRDQAHALKRMDAIDVRNGNEPPAYFVEEANLRGITNETLAAEILAKPNNVAVREIARQRMLLAIAAAKTPDELARIVSIPKNF